VEYVLANPHSYALAVTHSRVRSYALPSKDALEAEVDEYRAELMHQKVDQSRGQQLFDWLLGEIQELKEKRALIVVPDGNLHLLPFSALMNQGKYVRTSHQAGAQVLRRNGGHHALDWRRPRGASQRTH